MNQLVERLLKNPKTTALGALNIAGVVLGVLAHDHASWRWVTDGVGIVSGLTLLAMRDFKTPS